MSEKINREIIEKYDRSGMVEMVLSIPDQLRKGWAAADPISLEAPSAGGALFICGMGGSAIGAALAADLAGPECSFPIFLERGYTLPRFAGPDSTVICISYSGNTEEILSIFREAAGRGCSLGVITSGGLLKKEAEEAGAWTVLVEEGMPPRAAIGYLFAPLLKLLAGWKAVSLDNKDFDSITGTVENAIRNLSPDFDNNPAMVISERLAGRIPLIYTGSSLLKAAGYRWKCQFNENGKVMAFSNTFPELGHNEVMGWDCPGDIQGKLTAIFLSDTGDHPRVKRRMKITSSILKKAGADLIRIDSGSWFPEGAESPCERLLCMVALGDMSSVYLALRRGIDPEPIERIEIVKKRLRME